MKAFSAFLIFWFLTGCTKRNEKNVNAPCTDSCMTFNVRVFTGLNSATPLANTSIELGWSRPASPLGDPGRLIAKGKTSNTGSISFQFKAAAKELQGGQFYVSAQQGSDYFFQYNSYYGIQKFDSVINAKVHVPSKATLKIIYKNFTPTSVDDFFECSPSFQAYGSMGSFIQMKKTNGQSSNTYFYKTDGPFTRIELTGTSAGDQYTYFSILKKKNGIRVDLIDSIYIGKGQTKTYEVEF